MEPLARNNLKWLVVVLLLLGGYFYFLAPEWGGGSADNWEMDAFLGTWTEEGGEAGNSMHFYKVIQEVESYPGTQVHLGQARFVRHFGEGEVEATWNFEHWQPLRITIGFKDHSTFAAIRMLDHNRMLIRFSTDIYALKRDDVFTSADTKVMVRVLDGKPIAR